MAEAVRMPKMSDTMTEGVIQAWHKKVGDKVKAGDLLAEIETDKAVMEFESFQEGVLLYIGAEKGATIKVDEVIAILGKQGEDYKSILNQSASTQSSIRKESKGSSTVAGKEPVKEITTAKTSATAIPSTGRIKASPLAKKMAGDSGISLAQVKGSGDDGRITRRDVENFLSKSPVRKTSHEVIGEESFEDVPLSQMRKTVARRLAESKFSAPHYYLRKEVNMDRCVDFRTQINEAYPNEKISYNDIIIKATALALKKNPKVNSSWMGDMIRFNHHIHVGMAVAVQDGLLVPVIKFADQKSFSQISTEAKTLSVKAKEKKLQPEEMQGNTFTISNLGMMDIDEFTAIINPPDACILAVGKIRQMPVAVGNLVKVSSVLKLTLSCDHRAVDGATGAQFLQTLAGILEHPVTMLY